MSLPGQRTTTSFLEWDIFLSLIAKLERDKEYKFALLISLGVFTGLRISDLLKLKWSDVLEKDIVMIIEKKTQKTRTIKLNPFLQETLNRIKIKWDPEHDEIFMNRFGTRTLNIHYVNSNLKILFKKYNIKSSGNISSHLFRKTLGRRVVEMNNYSGESLILLSELFGHSSVMITRKYLGLRQEELLSVYDNLI